MRAPILRRIERLEARSNPPETAPPCCLRWAYAIRIGPNDAVHQIRFVRPLRRDPNDAEAA